MVAILEKKLVAKSASSVYETRLNDGGRVLLPYTILEEISRLEMVYPLQFRISAFFRGKLYVVYAAVLEFNAEIGVIVLPDWMFSHLNLREGCVVNIATCSLNGGSLVKLRPHKKAFVMLTDPRHVLEQRLVNYPILTKDTTIVINYAQQKFDIDVVEIYNEDNKPVDAVLTARADAKMTELKVEFERPLDMPPSPDTKELLSPIVNSPTSNNVIGSSADSGVQFKPFVFKPPSINSPTSSDKKDESEKNIDNSNVDGDDEKNKFVPFAGQGKSLGVNTNTAKLSAEEIRQKRIQALCKK